MSKLDFSKIEEIKNSNEEENPEWLIEYVVDTGESIYPFVQVRIEKPDGVYKGSLNLFQHCEEQIGLALPVWKHLFDKMPDEVLAHLGLQRKTL